MKQDFCVETSIHMVYTQNRMQVPDTIWISSVSHLTIWVYGWCTKIAKWKQSDTSNLNFLSWLICFLNVGYSLWCAVRWLQLSHTHTHTHRKGWVIISETVKTHTDRLWSTRLAARKHFSDARIGWILWRKVSLYWTLSPLLHCKKSLFTWLSGLSPLKIMSYLLQEDGEPDK